MKKTPNGSTSNRAGLLSTSTDAKVVRNGKSNGHASITISEKIKPKNKNGASLSSPNERESLQMQQLLQILDQVRNGNFNVRIPVTGSGINGKVCDTLNDIISLNETLFVIYRVHLRDSNPIWISPITNACH